MSGFSEFALSPPILDALIAEGYHTPTPIQSQAIPFVLAGRDLCGVAQTGTGKTAAFALPILHRLTSQPGETPRASCRVLVLSPTRELASQIAESFQVYGRHLPLSTAVVFGGVPLGPQQRRLAGGVDILVATPGRLLDLLDRRALTLDKVETLVLDEADRMLDLGFIHALKRIAKLLPERRQTLLFSATMPQAIASLAEHYLNNPMKVAVAPAATTADRVDQGVIFVASERKRDLLTTLLSSPDFERVLVFTRTKHGADRVVRHLVGAGIDAAAIHGNKSQPQRERALDGFRTGQYRTLVATDIAARGIDVEGVSHVINFELPHVPEDYVHRIGRTARAGAAGAAIALCSDEERSLLRGIEKLTRLSVPVLPNPLSTQETCPTLTAPPRVNPVQSNRTGSNRRSTTGAARKRTPPPDASSRRPETYLGGGELPAFLRQHGHAPAKPQSVVGRPASGRSRRATAL